MDRLFRRNFRGLHSLASLLDFKGDGLSLFQGFITLAGYRRIVNEQLLATFATGNEAIALCIVEPFNGSLDSVVHFYCPDCPNG